MPPTAVLYVFTLGVAAGLTLVIMGAYGRLSPRWLQVLLLASGALLAARYIGLTFLFVAPHEIPTQLLGIVWRSAPISFLLSSAVAVDQLLRHPAMTPKKLVRWMSPFLFAFALISLLAPTVLAGDPRVGWALCLPSLWGVALVAVQGVVAVVILGLGIFLARKIPSKPIIEALLLIGMAQAMWTCAIAGTGLRCTTAPPAPLTGDLLLLVALWYAFDRADPAH